MKVQDVMTRSPLTCFIQDPLHIAAQRLWERDCGCLPVVDPDQRPIAMITDRDICMAAFTTGKPLHELQVGQAMSKEVVACRDGDDLAAASARMAQHRVRRVPVVDSRGVLCGVLSLNDLAVRAGNPPVARAGDAASEAIRLLHAVSRHRDDGDAANTASAQAASPPSAQAAGMLNAAATAAASSQPQRDGRATSSTAPLAAPAPSRLAPSSGESSASATA
jgi:CBS domain-containing protein